MIAAHKVESENEEARDKVGSRSAVTTKPDEGTTELGSQIAKLMAALTRVRQGSDSASVPSIPRQRGCGRGQADRNIPACPNSHYGQTGLGQSTSACGISAGQGTGTTNQSQGKAQGSKGGQGSISNKKDPSSLQCFICQGCGHMAQECVTPAKLLNQIGEN